MEIINHVFTQLQTLNPNTLLAVAALGGSMYFMQSILSILFRGISKVFAKVFLRKIQIHYSHETSHKFNLWFSRNHKSARFNREFKTQVLGKQETLIPGYSNTYFFMKGYPLFFVSRQKEEKKNIYEETDIINITVISIFKSSVNRIYELFKDMDVDQHGGENITKVYKQDSDGFYWCEVGVVRKVLQPPNENVKDLENDIQRFVDLKELYNRRGLPHKRGYCLYGEPGTGKTSIVLHLAHKFKRNVYIIEKHSGELDEMLAQMKPNSIILVEDIDLSQLAGSKRDLDEIKDEDVNSGEDVSDDTEDSPRVKLGHIAGVGAIRVTHKKPNKTKSWVSSDALRKTLNLLDGVYSYTDSIFICTTNQKDDLDDALLRPGRIDKQVHITTLSPSEQLTFFNTFYETDRTEEITTTKYNISVYADILKQNMDSPEMAIKQLTKLEERDEHSPDN